MKKDFNIVDLVSSAKLVGQKAILYQNLGYDKDQIDNLLGITEGNDGRYYYASNGKMSVKYYIP